MMLYNFSDFMHKEIKIKINYMLQCIIITNVIGYQAITNF